MNLYQRYLESVRAMPDRRVVRWEGNEYSFTDLHRGALGVSAVLGDCRGTFVGLLAPNMPSFITGYFGILGSGATAVPLNAMLTPNELLPQGKHAGISTLLVAKPLAPLAQAMQAAGAPWTVRVIEEIPPAESADADGPHGDAHGLDDLAMILFTSGTTGDPKGVMLSHGNFLANFASYNEVFHFTKDHNFISVLPLFHSFAFTAQLMPAMLVGSRLLLHTTFKPKEVLQALTTEKNIVLTAVPPMFAVLAAMAPKGIEIRDNIHVIVSGGGALPGQVQSQFEAVFQVDIMEGYGLTEASPVVSCNNPGSPNKKGTIGKALPGVEVAIWDENNNPLPSGQEGELMVRGANVMQGYYKNESATRAALAADGWLHTGDLAVIDEEGYIRIVGRRKELIICAGENIHPREVEEVLVMHPAVFEAAVIGVPDELKNEVPKAFLAPPPGVPTSSIDIAEVRAFCRERLATHKVPVAWDVIESLPKTPTGKVAKRLLS